MGASRSSSTRSLLRMLCSKLVAKIDSMKEKEIVDILTFTYPYIGFLELRPVVLQIMGRCQQIPIPLLQSLNEQLPLLQIKVPVQVMQQLWKFSDKTFIEAINPLIKAYIIQAASSWSVRAVQVLHKTRIEEMEQVTMRSSSVLSLPGDAPGLLKPFDTIPAADLDLRQAFLSLPTVLISNPSEETLRIVQFESENLGPSRNAFTSFLDTNASPESQAESFANLVAMTTSAKEKQIKMGAPLNSYSTASSRELCVPLQLLTDYIGDQPQLYASTVRYIRRLMMEIQSYQLKLRPGIEFERQFPLLSSIGVLSLFTQLKPSQSQPESMVPAGVDPMLAQILAALRFDVLMAQHDRVHTSLCEQDELYRFAWCMDAIRRERAVEQRHYDEMEEIFTLLQTQLTPLKKPSSATSTASEKAAPVVKQADEKMQTRRVSGTKVVLEAAVDKKANAAKKAKAVSSSVAKTTKAKKASTVTVATLKTAKAEPSYAEDQNPLTRKERTAAARQTIRAALGRPEEDVDMVDDESDEEKKVFSRARPKRLRSNKPAPSTMDDLDLTDDEELEKPKRKKKKGKADEDSEDEWEETEKKEEDEEEEDNFEDAGMRVDEGDEYVDFSDGSAEEELLEEEMEEDFEEYAGDSDDYEYGTKKPAKRGSKKKTAAKTTRAKTTSSTPTVKPKATGATSGLKVALSGLTGTGGLASQASQRRDVTAASSTSTTSSLATGIKLKRGDKVLVDTGAALHGVADPRSAASLANTVVTHELEAKLNFLSECGWIISSGSMQMTIQTILFTILKDAAQKLSKPPSPAHCDPAQDLDTVKKSIVSDKRVSRLMTLLQLGCLNLPILHASEGLDNPVMIGLLAERILESKVVANLLSPTLSAISTKPWTRKNVSPESLNTYDRFINVLSAVVILTAYTERFDARNASKEAIKAEDDETMMENEQKRLGTMRTRPKRHQQASGDLAPDIRRTLLLALQGADESEEADDDDAEEPDLQSLPSTFHPDAAISLTLFWSLTQAGSANENVATAISNWITSKTPFWSKESTSQLHSYPTFIQEILFGFARIGPSSPVLQLRKTMVDSMLANANAPILLQSGIGILHFMSYLYLALTCNSIPKADAQELHTRIMDRIHSIGVSNPVLLHQIELFKAAIEPFLSEESHY